MSKTINLEVNAFTNIQSLVKKINEAAAGKNVSGIFYNKTSLLKGEIEIQLMGDVNVIEVPVAKGKGTGSSKYRGVFWIKSEQKWRAMIGYKGKRYPLGRFTNEEDAARAYDKKAFELLGKDAFLNFAIEKDEKIKIGDLVEFSPDFGDDKDSKTRGLIIKVDKFCKENLPYLVEYGIHQNWFNESELKKVCD